MSDAPSFDALIGHGESVVWFGTIVVALLATFRWLLTLAGGRQDKRITQLETAHEADNAKMIALAHALIEVMAVLERHDTNEPVLVLARAEAIQRARKALIAVFTVPGTKLAEGAVL